MPILRPPHISADEKRRYARTLALPRTAVQRRFLFAFMKFWIECVGLEIPNAGGGGAVDQAWYSAAFGCNCSFSGLAYITVRHGCALLDAWNMKRPGVPLQAIETELTEELPRLIAALHEAEDAARSSNNNVVAELVHRTKKVYDLLVEYFSRPTRHVRSAKSPSA